MTNGYYAYFGTNGNRENVQYAELNVLGDWNATVSYFASNKDAVYFGGIGTYIAIINNSNVLPNASTNSTKPAVWSPLVLLQSAPPNAISDVRISGNTSGQTANFNGVLVLAGGNNVTLSQHNNTISIIGGGGGGGGLVISAGTNAQLTGTVIFSNSNGISFGLGTDGKLTANYTVPSTTGLISALNVSAGAASNNLSAITFSNSNGVSFGLSNSVVTATVATNYQSQGAYLTTAGLSQDSSKYAGTSGAITGGSITLNTSGISIDLPAYLTTAALSQDSSKYAGTAGAMTGGSITLNTSGVSLNLPAYLTTADLSQNSSKYAGINGAITGGSLTVNTSGVSINLPAYLTTAMQSNAATISNINVSAGTTSTNASAFTFSNSNGISFGLGTGASAGVMTATVATNYQSQGAYLTTAALSGDTSKYAGINGAITGGSLTVNTSGVSINLPAYLTTAALSSQTLAFTLSGNVATTNSSQILNGSYALAGGNNVTIQQSNNTISISVGNYITTADLSQNSSKYAGINGAITGGSITVNTSGVSINLPAYLTTAMQSNAATISNINISAGTTSTNASAFTFSNSNGISFGLGTGASAGVVTATVATNYQSQGAYLTTAALSADTSNYAGINAAITGGSLTVNTSGVSINLPAYLTTAAQSSQTLQFTLGGNVATTNSSQIFNNGFILAGGANITIQQSNNSISISGATAAAAPIAFSAGTSSANVSSLVFNDSNGISFGLNGSTVTGSIAAPYCNYLEPLPMTNTALFGPGAGSWYFAPFIAPEAMSGGRLNLLHVNTSTAGLFIDITGASYASASTGTLQQSYTYSKAVALYSQGAGTNSTRLESIWSNSFSFGWSKDVRVSLSNATNINITVAHSVSYISEIGSNGAYTLNQFASAVSTTVANSSTSSGQFTNAGSSIRNMLSNSIIEPIGFNTTIQPGFYWLAFAWSSTRATASTGGLLGSAPDFSVSSELGVSRLVLESAFRNWGSTVTTARSHIMPYGLFTGAANMVPPVTLAFSSDLSSLASAWVPYFNFQNQGITK